MVDKKERSCGNTTVEGNWGIKWRAKWLPGRVKGGFCNDSSSQFLLSVQEQAASPNPDIHILKKKRKRKVRAAGGLGYTYGLEVRDSVTRGKRTGPGASQPVTTFITYLHLFQRALMVKCR